MVRGVGRAKMFELRVDLLTDDTVFGLLLLVSAAFETKIALYSISSSGDLTVLPANDTFLSRDVT